MVTTGLKTDWSNVYHKDENLIGRLFATTL
jgi:hypothetical protein